MKLLTVYVLVISVVLGGLLFLGSTSHGATETVVPHEKGSIFVELTGYSMYPTIKDGEVRKCDKQDYYSPGDVVTFSKDGGYVSHRIVGEVNGLCITKGDSNLLPDLFLIKQGEIICKVIC